MFVLTENYYLSSNVESTPDWMRSERLAFCDQESRHSFVEKLIHLFKHN